LAQVLPLIPWPLSHTAIYEPHTTRLQPNPPLFLLLQRLISSTKKSPSRILTTMTKVTCMTDEQLLVLRPIFSKSRRPSDTCLEDLAVQLDLPKAKVKNWFSNQRQKLAREEKGSRGQSGRKSGTPPRSKSKGSVTLSKDKTLKIRVPSIPKSTPSPCPAQEQLPLQEPSSACSSTATVTSTASPDYDMHTQSEYEMEAAYVLLALKTEIVFSTRLKSKLNSSCMLPVAMQSR